MADEASSLPSASPLSPHTMIPVLHLVVLSSGPNKALIMLYRALPCCCLRVESLSSVLTSAPLPLFIARTLQKVSHAPGSPWAHINSRVCVWQHVTLHTITSAVGLEKQWGGYKEERKKEKREIDHKKSHKLRWNTNKHKWTYKDRFRQNNWTIWSLQYSSKQYK